MSNIQVGMIVRPLNREDSWRRQFPNYTDAMLQLVGMEGEVVREASPGIWAVNFRSPQTGNLTASYNYLPEWLQVAGSDIPDYSGLTVDDFQIGQYVKALPPEPRYTWYVPSMDNHIGQVGVIVEKRENSQTGIRVRFDNSESDTWWYHPMFLELSGPPQPPAKTSYLNGEE